MRPGTLPRRPLAAAACEGLVEACWLVALVAIAPYFDVHSGRIFEPDKVAVLRLLAAVMMAAWAVEVLAGGRPWAAAPRRAPRALSLLLPAATFAASLALSTVLSVSPWRSAFGSYHRQQGLLTALSYLAIFFAVLAHLRRAEQWRRARIAIVLSSVPAAVYAVAQSLGGDPFPFVHAGGRVGSTLGNPIFLAAYLALALLVTADGIADHYRRARAVTSAARRRVDALAAAALGAAAAAQVAAILVSRSRGPLVGLAAGALVAAVVALQRARLRRETGATAGASRTLAWAAVAIPAAAGAAVLVLALAARPGSALASLRSLPYVDRLVSILDPADGTRRVRVLIWDGAVELMTSAPPLRTPSGHEDRLHGWRWLVGYGPECMDLAFNRVYPAALGRVESRGAVPDRAHDEPFDVLVTQGALGLAAWLWLLGAVLAASLRRLGLGARGLLQPGLSMPAGAAAGVAVTILMGRPGMAGLALVLGGVAGLLASLLAGGLRPPDGRAAGPAGARTPLLLAALVVVHAVETSVGIAVTPTRLLFFFALAALAADALGRARLGAADETADASATGRGERVAPPSLVLAACAVAVTAFSFAAQRPETARLLAPGASPLAVAERVAGRVGAFTVVLLSLTALLALVVAAASGPTGGSSAPRSRAGARLAGAGTIALIVAGVALVSVRPILAPIRADTLATHAGALIDAGATDAALELLKRARELAPREPAILTATVRGTVARQRSDDSPALRGLLLAAGVAASRRAARLEPLDPDHPVNHARALVAAAGAGATAEGRATMLAEAERLYRDGLGLRPQSVPFRTELAGVLLRRGELAAGRRELERAIALDPAYEAPALLLAALEHRLAVAARRVGDDGTAHLHLEWALATVEEWIAERQDGPELSSARPAGR